MAAAKIEMVNLRIDSTPSSEHPRTIDGHICWDKYPGKSPSAGKCFNLKYGLVPATTGRAARGPAMQ
jgi:hypothetical protein